MPSPSQTEVQEKGNEPKKEAGGAVSGSGGYMSLLAHNGMNECIPIFYACGMSEINYN